MEKIKLNNFEGDVDWDIRYTKCKFNLVLSVDGRDYIVNSFNTRVEAASNFDRIINDFINGKNEIPCRG